MEIRIRRQTSEPRTVQQEEGIVLAARGMRKRGPHVGKSVDPIRVAILREERKYERILLKNATRVGDSASRTIMVGNDPSGVGVQRHEYG